MKMQDDESLMEEQLLESDNGSSNEEYELEPELQEPKLYIICPGRSDLVLSEPFISSPKDCLFTLKEAIDKSQVILGTFSPRKNHIYMNQEEDVTPSGVFARGLYTARTQCNGTGGATPSDTSIVATVVLRRFSPWFWSKQDLLNIQAAVMEPQLCVFASEILPHGNSFQSVATPESVKNISVSDVAHSMCYYDIQVTDELVQGHPFFRGLNLDEAPHLVNPLVESFVARHASIENCIA
ncbi:hypothetical protein HAX54_026022 [Datura stramonium]|uniref:Uncharacterized protein n=1 Tax=Datura stramonium TaxID=4076 RepID=A0ABS8V0N2_DATST|nr:hypothetical protein [Datura stramonium]